MSERLGEIGGYWLSKRRGSDHWCRTWYDARDRQTKRASLGTVDVSEAKLNLWEWYAKYGRVERQQAAETPLELVLVRYWQQHAVGLPSSEMERIALRYWSEFFAGALVSEVTPQRQREFVAWLRDRRQPPLSDGYIKRVLTVGKSALNRAYREGELTSVPYVIPGRDSPPRDLVLTVDQCAAFWNAAERPHEAMFLALAFGTLARPEAILGLHRRFADTSRWLLDQNPPGRRQTKKFRPVVPIAPFLRPWIENAPEGPLVAWKGKPVASFKSAWRRMRRDAGLPMEAVPKTIRHTVATALRERGVPEADIQGMLGHRAYSGKTEVYAKYRPEYLGAAVAAIEDFMRAVRVSCVLDGRGARWLRNIQVIDKLGGRYRDRTCDPYHVKVRTP